MTDSKAMMAMFDAFDNANQGLAIWDEGDNLIGFNSIYRDIFKNNMLSEPKIGINFGQSYEEASKKPEFQLSSENIKQRFAIRKQARKDKKPIENESKLENGIWLNVRETASNDGHMITVITDVTESKNSAEMQSRLSNAIDSIPSHVMFWDKDENLIKANELAINENLEDGIRLSEGMSYSEFLTSQFSKELYSVPKDFSVEKFVEKRLKERAELTSKSTKVRYKNGKTVIRTENKLADGGILTILNDVSELEEKEASEKLLSLSIDNMSGQIALWNKDLKLVRFNLAYKEAADNFAVKVDLGMSFRELLSNQIKAGMFFLSSDKEKKEWLDSMKSQMGALEDLDASKSIELGKKIKRKFSSDSKIQEMVKKVSDRVEENLESSMNSYSEVDVKKLKPGELLSLNKDSCQLMELRPGDELSMQLCIESNREVKLRKRRNFRAWAKEVQKFQQRKEDELRKKLRNYK